ncbi:hypothetical protein Gotur_030509, partial [Gossypium turneri]
RALGHIDEAVTDLFDRLDKGVTPKVDKVSYRVFSENYSPLKEMVATPRRDDISMEKWMAILQNLQEEDIEWRAPWLLPDEILYRCGNFDWVPLLGIWGAIGYAPLLVLRQYRSRQFVPATQGLAECEFSYGGDGYKKRIREISNAWNQTRSQSIEENLRVVPSELEILKQDFERRNAELEKQIEQMEGEKMNLRLDADVQKLEMERLRKGKARAEKDLDSLKTDYKKLRSSMRTVGLERLLNSGNETLKRSLSENQKEKWELENRVSELEESLHRHRNQNSVMELKASLNRIEEMKERIEELEAALQSCEVRIEHLESNEDRQAE